MERKEQLEGLRLSDMASNPGVANERGRLEAIFQTRAILPSPRKRERERACL